MDLSWNLGTGQPPATTPNVGEVLDGTYLLSAKGYDAYGQAGSAKNSTVIAQPPRSLPARRTRGRP